MQWRVGGAISGWVRFVVCVEFVCPYLVGDMLWARFWDNDYADFHGEHFRAPNANLTGQIILGGG